MRFTTAFTIVIFVSATVTVTQQRYAVYSPSCHMLSPDPLDDSIIKFVHKEEPKSCSSKPPLTSVSQAGRSHVLHLHKENFQHYSPTGSPISCVYDLIKRIDNALFIDAETRYKMDSHNPLNGDLAFIEGAEFVRVKCFLNGDNLKEIYINMHAFIGYKEVIGKKISKNLGSPANPNKLGVMMIGFDSMSRSSIQRNMPKTVRYLTSTGWRSMEGYNKVEDNTFPNLMAVLSGRNVQQLKETCWFSIYDRLDSCPIIWKNFSAKGYITAYAEDSPGTSTFNNAKMGFENPPTDYYLRPFMLAAESISKNGCSGPSKMAHHIFNYSIDFAECFLGHPTFSLFWHNSFSHNVANEPSTMDDDTLNYFKRLTRTGILNNTVMIFLSDHGLRVGPLRETYVGHVEARQPFLYIRVPDWFRNTQPVKFWNLIINSRSLTSSYDLYLTLADILGEKTTAKGCPSCQTLFNLLPWNRSCAEAGITEHWCTCNEYENMVNDTLLAGNLALAVVNKINLITSAYRCSRLELKKILSLRQRTFGVPRRKSYIITIQTTPGNGKFEATAAGLSSSSKDDGYSEGWEIFETVSRINLYGSQSHCVRDPLIKEYCYCKHSTTTRRN